MRSDHLPELPRQVRGRTQLGAAFLEAFDEWPCAQSGLGRELAGIPLLDSAYYAANISEIAHLGRQGVTEQLFTRFSFFA
jgi:hypothetical protein